MKGVMDWLPSGVVAWLPKLPSVPSLSSIIPSYIPGINFEAEVHRGPSSVPTPTDILHRVNNLVREAQDALHKKQQQLIELIKCTCPRPARCDGLFQVGTSGSTNGMSSARSRLGRRHHEFG